LETLTTHEASQSLPSFGRMNGLQHSKHQTRFAVNRWKKHDIFMYKLNIVRRA